MQNDFLKNSKKIVIKIGSSLLIKKNEFNSDWLQNFIEDIIFLKKNKIEVLIVTSGAVSLGKKYLRIDKKKIKINEKQAFAACGQVILMNNFKKSFAKKKIKVAQILLTYSDTEDRRKSLNSRETIFELLKYNIIPVINENDTVATDELKFGDNDRLAARVSQIVSADKLFLLSDVDGLYTKNPKIDKQAELLVEINEIDENHIKMAGNYTNIYGTGGMQTKVEAAKIATGSGCDTVICNGIKKNPIQSFLKKKIGTLFLSKVKKESGFKKWLAGTIKVTGNLVIDDGAKKAIINGASILPRGVKKISGNFFKGDIIEVNDMNGNKLGKGVTYYDSEELKVIMGRKTTEIKKLLGYEGREEIIHRDYLTLND